MSNLKRESEILSILKEKSYATVDYLAKNIHTSPSSIRRDLTNLDAGTSFGLTKNKNLLHWRLYFRA